MMFSSWLFMSVGKRVEGGDPRHNRNGLVSSGVDEGERSWLTNSGLVLKINPNTRPHNTEILGNILRRSILFSEYIFSVRIPNASVYNTHIHTARPPTKKWALRIKQKKKNSVSFLLNTLFIHSTTTSLPLTSSFSYSTTCCSL